MNNLQLSQRISNPLLIPETQNKTGCWVVGTQSFSKKIDALRHATNTHEEVSFYFYDSIWEGVLSKFRNLNNNSPALLPNLYKARAQMIRDKYDHLVLYFSGGSDSYNILHTFLSNNIKLDEIVVRWSRLLIDGKFYTPNVSDTSGRNGASEWNFAIKPVLDKLRISHPEIKITIIDPMDSINVDSISLKKIETRIIDVNLSRPAPISTLRRVNDNHFSTSLKKNTGNIFGIEKPKFRVNGNKLFFYFIDLPFDQSVTDDPSDQCESFYWNPDFPLLLLEQCNRVAAFLKINKQYIDLFKSDTKSINANTLRERLVASIIYKHSWNPNTFQADKPNEDRSDWYFWLYESAELDKLRNNLHRGMLNLTDDIDSRLLINTKNTPLYSPVSSKLFYITDLGE